VSVDKWRKAANHIEHQTFHVLFLFFCNGDKKEQHIYKEYVLFAQLLPRVWYFCFVFPLNQPWNSLSLSQSCVDLFVDARERMNCGVIKKKQSFLFFCFFFVPVQSVCEVVIECVCAERDSQLC
jgi:hypothetical protein